MTPSVPVAPAPVQAGPGQPGPGQLGPGQRGPGEAGPAPAAPAPACAAQPVPARSGRPRAIVIAGPTASGKSRLALALAERLGGLIINADSMQVYRELAILTARPTAAELARLPHALYGFL